MGPQNDSKRESPDCLHYFVIWEPDKPRGCHAWEFKSPDLPSQVVLESSGEECQQFERGPISRERPKLLR